MLRHAAPQSRLVRGPDCRSYGMIVVCIVLISGISRSSSWRIVHASSADQNRGAALNDFAAVDGWIARPSRRPASDRNRCRSCENHVRRAADASSWIPRPSSWLAANQHRRAPGRKNRSSTVYWTHVLILQASGRFPHISVLPHLDNPTRNRPSATPIPSSTNNLCLSALLTGSPSSEANLTAFATARGWGERPWRQRREVRRSQAAPCLVRGHR